MISDIDKLRSLYIKYDTLVASGDDVVADLRKEINNLELSVLRDSIIPKVAKLLYRESFGLRCSIDCSIQSINGKIEYSFCTNNSPLIRATISKDDNLDIDSPNNESALNSEILNNLTFCLDRLSELSSEIDSCKANTLKYVSQLQRSSYKKETEQTSPTIFETLSTKTQPDKILYCRSKTCNAKGRLLPNRDIIVLKGSLIRGNATPTYRPKKFRNDILERYCSLTENGYIVLNDLPPMSVSSASGFCLGRSSNGNVDWKDEHGICLADLT